MNPIAINTKAGETYWWCRCGRSARQPLCDGAHKGSGSAPLKFTATETGQAWLCVCKRTANPPFCDGSHKSAAAPTDS